MRSQRTKKKVRLNLKKFIPFVVLLIAAIVFITLGIKQFTKPHEITGGPQEIENQPPKEPTYVDLSILCGGDVMAHTDQIKTAKQSDDTYDFSDQFIYVKEYFEKADLSMVNIETTFSGDGKYSGYPSFDAPDALASNVKDMGIDVALFANNHMLDTGLNGAKRSVEVLRNAGMEVVGARANTSENRSIIVDVKGVKVGIVAYTYETEKIDGARSLNGSVQPKGASDYINSFRYYEIDKDQVKIADEITWCKENGANIVICYMHWGNEYKLSQSSEDSQLARYIAECGADIIFASHPHAVQKAEVMEVGVFEEITASDGSIEVLSRSRQVPIFYSVGNFVSNQRTESLKSTYGEDKARRSEQGIIANVDLKVCLDDGTFELTKVDYIPIWVDRMGSSGNYIYRVIPLVENFETKYSEFLQSSGHTTRAKAAREEIQSIVNLVTTY